MTRAIVDVSDVDAADLRRKRREMVDRETWTRAFAELASDTPLVTVSEFRRTAMAFALVCGADEPEVTATPGTIHVRWVGEVPVPDGLLPALARRRAVNVAIEVVHAGPERGHLR